MSSVSQVLCRVKYSVEMPDERTPWIPNDAFLRGVLADKYPYPSPYPANIEPTLALSEDEVLAASLKSGINISGSVLQSIERVICVAATYLNIRKGSVLVADTILLKAPVIRISDDGMSAIRTSIIPRKKLIIETDLLIVHGADIFLPEECELQVKEVVDFTNCTSTTQLFLGTFLKDDSDGSEVPSETDVQAAAGGQAVDNVD